MFVLPFADGHQVVAWKLPRDQGSCVGKNPESRIASKRKSGCRDRTIRESIYIQRTHRFAECDSADGFGEQVAELARRPFDPGGVLEIVGDQTSEPLLSCGVPELQPEVLVVVADVLADEVDSDCGLSGWGGTSGFS